MQIKWIFKHWLKNIKLYKLQVSIESTQEQLTAKQTQTPVFDFVPLSFLSPSDKKVLGEKFLEQNVNNLDIEPFAKKELTFYNLQERWGSAVSVNCPFWTGK